MSYPVGRRRKPGSAGASAKSSGTSSRVVGQPLEGILGIWRNLWEDGHDLASHALMYTKSQLKAAQEAGADHLIDYRTEDLRTKVLEITGGRGADVIYDPVGGDLFDQAIRAIAWNGRLLVVGFASGRIPELPVNLALLKGAAVLGVFWGSFAQRQPQDNAANFQQLFGWFAEGKLKPLVSQVYPLSNAAQAINDLGQRKAVGKVVVQVR